MSLRTILAAALVTVALPACRKELPPPDPEGKDMIEGAVVAAAETVGDKGVRLYKVVHFHDYPPPVGYEYDMIAYDPKVPTFDQAAALWKSKPATIAACPAPTPATVCVIYPHFNVRWVNFAKRDHRIVAVEPLNDGEKKIYKPQDH